MTQKGKQTAENLANLFQRLSDLDKERLLMFGEGTKMTDLVRTDRALCPLRSIGQAEPVPCAGKLCAWWDGPLGYCSIFTLADSMRGVESQTGALTVALENLEKSVPASVTSTSGDEAGSV